LLLEPLPVEETDVVEQIELLRLTLALFPPRMAPVVLPWWLDPELGWPPCMGLPAIKPSGMGEGQLDEFDEGIT
jgi:hypothetical protein